MNKETQSLSFMKRFQEGNVFGHNLNQRVFAEIHAK